MNTVVQVTYIRLSEMRAYAQFDVVMTITQDDIDKMLSPSLDLDLDMSEDANLSLQDRKKIALAKKKLGLIAEVREHIVVFTRALCFADLV
jgi:hypothetical protein